MVNIELDTNPWALIDADVLASAVYNVGQYFTGLRMLRIHLRFCEAVPLEPEHIKDIVSSLAKLEALLPRRKRLHVLGIEAHEACQIAWGGKSRKSWE